MKLNTSEARRLGAEFDETPYMDRNGTLQTTQSQGIGNIRLCHIPHNRVRQTTNDPSFCIEAVVVII